MYMTGHISPKKAEVKLTAHVYNQPGGPTLDFEFTGNAIPGPQLLTSEANPTTDGKLNVTDASKKNAANGMGGGGHNWTVVSLLTLVMLALSM